MDDQKRTIRAGANYLVVGSPIRNAADPVAAARALVAATERGAGMLAPDQA
jgi:orotidine-5'-phosphate decarboxylase